MTDEERELRKKIAKEIQAKYGALAPYAMVAEFVKNGQVKVDENKRGRRGRA